MRKKKIEKTHAKEKQSHAQDNIYVVWQFTYVHGVAGISLLSGKNTKCGYSVFFSLKKHDQQQTLISKLRFSTSCASAWADTAPWTKPQKISH